MSATRAGARCGKLWRMGPTFREAAVRGVVALTIGGTVVGLLAGCAQGSSPTVSPTTSPTSSARVSRLGPSLNPEAPPSSEREAFIAANKTVNDDEMTLFQVLQLKIPGDLFGTFEAGPYRTAMGNTINDDFEDAIEIGADVYVYNGMTGRAPLWFPRAKSSWASTLIVKGKSYPDGIVHLSGCFQDRRVFRYAYSVESGSPTPTPLPTPISGALASNPLTPTRVTVQYQPAKRVWLIVHYCLTVSLAEEPAGWAESRRI